MPEPKVQGIVGSLGDKQGFAYIMDRTVTGRLASILKSAYFGYINIIMVRIKSNVSSHYY